MTLSLVYCVNLVSERVFILSLGISKSRISDNLISIKLINSLTFPFHLCCFKALIEAGDNAFCSSRVDFSIRSRRISADLKFSTSNSGYKLIS